MFGFYMSGLAEDLFWPCVVVTAVWVAVTVLRKVLAGLRSLRRRAGRTPVEGCRL